MSERKKIGYVHEFHPNFDDKSWIADQDMMSEDPAVHKEVQCWLYGLANPWSNTAVQYNVYPQYKPGGAPYGEEWVAEYVSIFYDCMKSVALGYGSSPMNAVNNVTNMVNDVLRLYYRCDKNDYSVDEDIDDGLVSSTAARVLNCLYIHSGNIPMPIIGDDVVVIAKNISDDEDTVRKSLSELVKSCFVNRIVVAEAVKYYLTPIGIAYCRERFD